MRTRGFLRRAFLIVGLAWLTVHFFLANGRYVADPDNRNIGWTAISVMSVWGVLTLLANRTR